MLALETGWTPDVLADLPLPFKRKCHWVLFARTVSGPDGLPSTDIPSGLPYAAKLEMQKQIIPALKMRALLYPEDTNGDA